MHELIEDKVGFHIVMDLVDGVTNIIKIEKKLSMNNLAHISYKILVSLHYIHEKNIAHRDIKPDNIMVVKQADGYDVKLIDFGLGVELDNNKHMSACGTPIFMPPEMWRDVENHVHYQDIQTEISQFSEALKKFIKTTAEETQKDLNKCA